MVGSEAVLRNHPAVPAVARAWRIRQRISVRPALPRRFGLQIGDGTAQIMKMIIARQMTRGREG